MRRHCRAGPTWSPSPPEQPRPDSDSRRGIMMAQWSHGHPRPGAEPPSPSQPRPEPGYSVTWRPAESEPGVWATNLNPTVPQSLAVSQPGSHVRLAAGTSASVRVGAAGAALPSRPAWFRVGSESRYWAGPGRAPVLPRCAGRQCRSLAVTVVAAATLPRAAVMIMSTAGLGPRPGPLPCHDASLRAQSGTVTVRLAVTADSDPARPGGL